MKNLKPQITNSNPSLPSPLLVDDHMRLLKYEFVARLMAARIRCMHSNFLARVRSHASTTFFLII